MITDQFDHTLDHQPIKLHTAKYGCSIMEKNERRVDQMRCSFDTDGGLIVLESVWLVVYIKWTILEFNFLFGYNREIYQTSLIIFPGYQIPQLVFIKTFKSLLLLILTVFRVGMIVFLLVAHKTVSSSCLFVIF